MEAFPVSLCDGLFFELMILINQAVHGVLGGVLRVVGWAKDRFLEVVPTPRQLAITSNNME